jgi:hypothetical protein
MKMSYCLLLIAALSPARADVLFTQSPPNGNNFDITDYRLADDFTVAADATLNEIGFWYDAQQETDLAAVTYAVYKDDGGAPGTLLQSETVDGPPTSFDSASGLFHADFSVDPLPLAGASSYWLELHAGASLTDDSGFTVSWGAADDNATAIALESLTLGVPDTPVDFSGFDQYAFVLGTSSSSSSVPEPAPISLLLGALGVLALLKCRARGMPGFAASRKGEIR